MVKKAVTSAALEAAGSSTRGNGWAPRGPASPWEYQAAQSHQARPEEAQKPSWGTAKGVQFGHAAVRALGTCLAGDAHERLRRDLRRVRAIRREDRS